MLVTFQTAVLESDSVGQAEILLTPITKGNSENGLLSLIDAVRASHF